MNLTPAPVTEYGGFELAIGSVFAVRWFKPDTYGRLHAINHNFIWKPGENIAKCQRGEGTWVSFGAVPMLNYNSHAVTLTYDPIEPESSLADEAVKAKVKVEHLVPMDSCGCGFYAFADNCDDGGYGGERAVGGVVECYGRTILGTRGLRCEKARIVALATDRADIRRNYPDVRFYDPVPKPTRFRRKQRPSRMLSDFDVIQPYTPTPDDPDFWERP